MSTDFQLFEAAVTPLTSGVNLVEASAGTGKTYALAMLVLRFIVERDVAVDRILVVTFTQAATEELRGRIRSRIVEARMALVGGRGGGDATLEQWLAEIKDRDLAVARLEQALLDMDRASIFTIHGFCQRVLREQALDSGLLFDAHLLADTRLVVQEVVEDYWRRQLYDLSPDECAPLVAAYPTPAALYQSVKSNGAFWDRIEPEPRSLEDGLAAYAGGRKNLSLWWQQHQERLFMRLNEALEQGLFKKPMTADFNEWWQGIDDFCHGRSPRLPKDLARLAQAGMLACLNGNKIRSVDKRLDLVESWALPQSEVTICEAAIRDLRLTFRGHLVRGLHGQVTQGLLRRNRLGFDDLITLLSQALVGPRAQQLRCSIGERFQVALIDEFQDTDQRQYQIFSTLFGSAQQYLYLIGDPKQAIYRFRGADIHAYYRARESAASLLGLGHNYRSHPNLVAAVNRLFTAHLTPFHPVTPARNAAEIGLSCSGLDLSSLLCCHLPENPSDKKGRWSSGLAREQIIASLTREICTLLDPDRPLLFGNQEDSERLEARDIAILVRNSNQGQACREALLRAGIPTVLTSRKSVFDSSECLEFIRILRAVCTPVDPELLKAAMTCSWFGLSGTDIHALWLDDGGAEAWLERFQGYAQCWQEQGFLVMMGRLLTGERVFENLAKLEWSERRITNINHLLELIHAAVEEEALAPTQVLQWLVRLVDGDGASPDKSELRLESDERAVRIVTIHAAKGLQYPVVFCPFLWYSIRYDHAPALVCQAQDGTSVLDIGSPAFTVRQKQRNEEDWAEELRLVYVALTRAVSRCYLYWADVKARKPVADARSTALASILGLQDAEDGLEQERLLRELSGELGGEYQALGLDTVQVPVVLSEPDHEVLVCRTKRRKDLEAGWRLHSYSSLAHLSFNDPDEPESDPDFFALKEDRRDNMDAERPRRIEEPELSLPAGPGFGNLIHALLEEIPFPRLAGESLRDAQLLEYCRRFQQNVEVAPLRRLLVQTTTTPLLAGDMSDSFALSQLAQSDCLQEMPFTLHLRGGSTARLNDVLAGQPAVRPVGYQDLRGYLTGFIDLVCRFRGRYYLIDYKSNRLGADSVLYAPEGLVSAMREHNYGLQYWIYSLVLQNYLAQTLVDYSHEDHFGGVCYLFVRGMDPAVPGSGVYFDRPDEILLDRLHRAMTGGED